MSKPREWKAFVCEQSKTSIIDGPDTEGCLHLVENSAYDALLAQAEAIAEALDEEILFSTQNHYKSSTKTKKALTSWQAFKEKL